jgi:hypothetical protein
LATFVMDCHERSRRGAAERKQKVGFARGRPKV